MTAHVLVIMIFLVEAPAAILKSGGGDTVEGASSNLPVMVILIVMLMLMVTVVMGKMVVGATETTQICASL